MHVPQNAFERNLYGPWRHKYESERERTKKRTKKKPAKEIVVVDDDDDDEDEGVKENEKANIPMSPHQALAAAFSFNWRIET